MALKVRIFVLTVILTMLIAGISIFAYAASEELYRTPYIGGTFVYRQLEEVL